MCPIEPAKNVTNLNESPMAPPYVDENPDLELVKRGLRVAEDETRDMVTRRYETEAAASSDPEEALDDIAYPLGSEPTLSPELAAMKEERSSSSKSST